MKTTCQWIACVALVVLLGCGGPARRQQKQLSDQKRVAMAAVMVDGQAASCISHFRSLWAAWEYAKVSGEDFVSASKTILGPESGRMRQELLAGKLQVDDLMARLEPVPEGFQGAVDRLRELHEIYLKIYEMAVNPPDSLEGCLEKISEWEGLFALKARELEALLPGNGSGDSE